MLLQHVVILSWANPPLPLSALISPFPGTNTGRHVTQRPAAAGRDRRHMNTNLENLSSAPGVVLLWFIIHETQQPSWETARLAQYKCNGLGCHLASKRLNNAALCPLCVRPLHLTAPPTGSVIPRWPRPPGTSPLPHRRRGTVTAHHSSHLLGWCDTLRP